MASLEEKVEAQEWLERPLLGQECPRCAEGAPPPYSGSKTRSIQSLAAPPVWLWVAQVMLLMISISVTTYALKRVAEREVSCVQKLSFYSPALEAVGEEYELRQFKGTINGFSPYKGHPKNQSVMDAWWELMHGTLFSIDDATRVAIGAPDTSVRLPPEKGGGFLAGLDLPHQLHCLNMLWTQTFGSEYASEQDDPTSMYRKHLDHCADMLRQKLECSADAGILTYNWVQNLSHPTPNFNTWKKCRNSTAIRSWMWDHEIPRVKEKFVMQEGDVVLEDFP